MGKPRTIHKYYVKVGNRIVHVGTTDDLERKEKEHKKTWPNGKIVKVGRRTTEEAAKKWKEKKGQS